ncbi:MAG: hypothetical protein UW46_C0008G0007 [Candidatus Yanofskybacteria bacterium GW2011_GWF1_44_227]|uniref:PPM-type phosphatase domain-containing protein n=1 Tax=Candidatus Yanofskybacteria bacterium GW2011_GWE2_40_11 TaxID=1619033 RepID=A0A0G0QIR9_9BACT|nr:MAG: hypothetical protein UT69_C0003G0030 [Candidatus Yanofskybacteria bacterium GW2011_GWE1_40_10]KKR40249.1 MAG: hypothetical protein UT75_C0009G0022 [Candidatus Yanofskybacteria bacterium GW2011_GWE2_40_11]KKT15331.1 MAG: hypothetical protein UV97_C0009G0007 [Candidatus Yanofskybacteria bacterium GW2011_GWF2_43_596]KKT52975.1 MAG: hypothetical protein UW46_C0008G0007 [Candidatus Yanofskybacteria bacterium GW2011_GWF1_44_227]OGN36128.1 MAG: hypothetical protein A2241_00040 [Candidatus Yano
MEKIVIKPTSHEILVRGTNQDGHADLFAYDAEREENKRGLGNLFIIGNIQDSDGDQSDVAYITNLVASLAKREYYSRAEASPKEALSSALKKINDVVDEFFKNKNLEINIGIFAVAGENILISRLGKFKIFLARDGKTIDILNNVELFSKEHIEEKKFSSVISGKVGTSDKILAFYPGKAITSRERFIKADFIKFERDAFIEKMLSLKETKKDFGCAALYISIDKFKESTTKKDKPKKIKSTVEDATIKLHPEMGVPILAANEKTDDENKDSAQNAPIIATTNSIIPQEEEMRAELMATKKTEIPNIIPAEFTRGRKKNQFWSILNRIRISDFNPNKGLIKKAGIGAGVALLIIVIMVVRSYVVVNTEDKATTESVKRIQSQIDIAEDRVRENKLSEARTIISTALTELWALPDSSTSKVKTTIDNAIKVIDSFDKATEASLSLYANANQDGLALLQINSYGDSFGAIADMGGKIFLSKIIDGAVSRYLELSDTKPSSVIFSAEGDFSIGLDENAKKIAVSNDEKTRTIDLSSLATPKDIGYYQDNLYILSSDKISKVVDVVRGGKSITNWSQDPVPADAKLMVVDGNIFVIGTNGMLTRYFRGKKEAEFNIQIPATDRDYLLSTKDSKNLYLVSSDLGRVYTIDKESGSIVKSIKIGNVVPIVGASLSQAEVLYILTSDNKIWKIN